MKLRCVIGSLVIMKPRMHLSCGDVFDINEKIGSKLIASGDACEVELVPVVESYVAQSEPNPPGIEEATTTPTSTKTVQKRRR